MLRDHLVQGYTVNQARLNDLDKAIQLVASTTKRRDLSGDEAKALLAVVADYNRALELLDHYDHQRIRPPGTSGVLTHRVEHAEALRIVARLRDRFGESDLFGVEKDQGLESALGAIMQTAGGKEVYPSLEEKAAHLLYFLVKNHAFVDGNKRIAAALLLWFLERNQALYLKTGAPRLTNEALVAITLLIAESKANEEPVLVRIVTHLMCEPAPPA